MFQLTLSTSSKRDTCRGSRRHRNRSTGRVSWVSTYNARVPKVVRAVTTSDLDQLQQLDAEYSRALGLEPLVDSGVVSFYERSGHSFVLEDDGTLQGFLLAQAVWNGRRPEVQLRRLVARDDGGRSALLEAVVKSAYDAGVYDLLALLPGENGEMIRALEKLQFSPGGVSVYELTLGSRGSGTR